MKRTIPYEKQLLLDVCVLPEVFAALKKFSISRVQFSVVTRTCWPLRSNRASMRTMQGVLSSLTNLSICCFIMYKRNRCEFSFLNVLLICIFQVMSKSDSEKRKEEEESLLNRLQRNAGKWSKEERELYRLQKLKYVGFLSSNSDMACCMLVLNMLVAFAFAMIVWQIDLGLYHLGSRTFFNHVH